MTWPLMVWIGGAPGAGKSTIARDLARRWDLPLHPVDLWTYDHVGRMPVGMVVPTGALIAVAMALTVLAGPIFAYSGRAADEVLDRGQYISAVVGPR